jgi:hypothetical protein
MSRAGNNTSISCQRNAGYLRDGSHAKGAWKDVKELRVLSCRVGLVDHRLVDRIRVGGSVC